ncbi:MAG: hypothetical protein FJ167_15325, partial [Gammaproteobacteria bacterium]|nr:hypothetical protein [Gammaproteobacteria bacterium]
MKQLWIILFATFTLSAQFGTRAVIRTTGQYDRDGSALYSVFVAAGNDDLGNLNIAVALPPGARFIEQVHAPLGAVYEGVQKDAIFYAVPDLEKGSLLGPFVFRVRPDGTGQDLPASLYSVVAFQRPAQDQVVSPAPEGKLVRFADRGVITLDRRGTIDASGNAAPVTVGETGVVLLIPEGALDQEVKITVTRVPFETLQLPVSDPPLWWCATYDIRMEPQVAFQKPVAISLPTRRAVTPGLEIVAFSAADAPLKNSARAFGLGSLGGTLVCFSQFGQ